MWDDQRVRFVKDLALCVIYSTGMARSTTPASDSSAQEIKLARWYEFFKDACNTATRLGYGIACHPDQKSPIQDMMERVYEDPSWGGRTLPPLLVTDRVPAGTYQWVDQGTLDLISFEAGLKSRKGLGRFRTAYTPDTALKRM